MTARGKKQCQKEATLCWTCERAVGGCPWTARDEKTHQVRFEPVEGWAAEKTIVNGTRAEKGRKVYVYATESYLVRKCPLYQKDRRTAAKCTTPILTAASGNA